MTQNGQLSNGRSKLVMEHKMQKAEAAQEIADVSEEPKRLHLDIPMSIPLETRPLSPMTQPSSASPPTDDNMGCSTPRIIPIDIPIDILSSDKLCIVKSLPVSDCIPIIPMETEPSDYRNRVRVSPNQRSKYSPHTVHRKPFDRTMSPLKCCGVLDSLSPSLPMQQAVFIESRIVPLLGTSREFLGLDDPNQTATIFQEVNVTAGDKFTDLCITCNLLVDRLTAGNGQQKSLRIADSGKQLMTEQGAYNEDMLLDSIHAVLFR